MPYSNNITKEHYTKSVRYLPWVGFFISVAGALVMYSTYRIFPRPISVGLGMLVTVLLTGALHEDGLADVCDGFGGGYSKQRILDIMKDSRIGTFGVIGLILSFLLKFSALSEMPPFFMAVFFITGNTISRFTLVTLMYKYPYARTDETSKAKTVIGNLSVMDMIIAFIPVIPAFLLTENPQTLLFIIPVWITKWIFARYFTKKINGYTGDCMGATQQITEIVFYLTALVWLKFTW